ncbi:trypsin-like peptidase domain-containing protein [Sulfurimonas sp.]|uniref:trypsin-like peptidase domain-containing protein n=1 Tax=Sulfurimonas sp. TaxID=2022749 RepID=UPI0025E04B73|nr:trypsin-like peptidase domain-containing protein [Sulfurimonas sp.]
MKNLLLICLLTLTMAYAKDGVEFKYADENIQRKNPTSQNFILSYNNVLENVRTSVVNISTRKTISSGRAYGNPFNNNQGKVPQGASGSGVIISKDGYIVTNNHVVSGADEIKVSIAGDKKEYEAKLIGTDAKSDVAIIKIDASKLNAVTFYNSDKVKVGDVVFALGNPFGVGETITQGIVSATGRSGIGIVEYENFIQTDASINPGNSGGALINSAGHLIGINSAIISKSGGNDGIGLSIPSNMVTSIAMQLIDTGKYSRAYLGVGISDVNEDMSSFYDNRYGGLIISIEENSPAAKAGLKRGDLIISINRKKIDSASKLKNTIGAFQPLRVVNIKFLRDKKVDIVNVKLGLLDNQIASVTKNYKGMNVVALPTELQRLLRANANIHGGVLVDDVELNTQAHSIGILKDDIIVQIEDIEITSIDDFKTATSSQNKKRIYIFRRGNIFAIVL